MEVYQVWSFAVVTVKIEVAHLGPVLTQLSHQVGSDHAVEAQLVNERVHLLAELFLCVTTEGKRGRLERMNSDCESEGVAEAHPLVEVHQHVLVHGFRVNPVGASCDELSQLDNIALSEALLV